MHFSIPETEELKDENGSVYTVYNIHVNGVFHCTLRYKQLHNFHEQLKIQYASSLPPYPPKKWLALNPVQLEERRYSLERYIQIVSQNPQICNSEIFNSFLLSAQQETQQQDPEEVLLDIYLMNGHRSSVRILSTDQTDQVLEKLAMDIELADDYVYYFGLFLIEKEEKGENSIVRKMQEFESPYISLMSANKNGVHRIVLRKSYWDLSYDADLLDDRICMNLLYVQALSDVERGWVQASKEQTQQLATLQHKGSKKEYLQLARTLKYYGYIQFKPCITDYPHPDSAVLVAAGNKELHFRVQVGSEVKEGTFKVTRMRCWRLTTSFVESNVKASSRSDRVQLELSFEYLMSKETLQWIRIVSDQAILMSVCLQKMVDELLLKKQGKRFKKPQDRNKRSSSHVFLKRDGSSHVLKQISNSENEENGNVLSKSKDIFRRKQDKVSIRNTQNDVYEGGVGDYGIGDDDL